jgi:hypothetical protein
MKAAGWLFRIVIQQVQITQKLFSPLSLTTRCETYFSVIFSLKKNILIIVNKEKKTILLVRNCKNGMLTATNKEYRQWLKLTIPRLAYSYSETYSITSQIG